MDQVTPNKVDGEKCCTLRPLAVGGTQGCIKSQDHNLPSYFRPTGAANLFQMMLT